MTDPLTWLDETEAERTRRGLVRRLSVREPNLLNFASNDYLGLAADPRVVAAAKAAADRFGFGSGASPLVSGWSAVHEELARALAEFERVEAVALFPTGFAANLGVIGAMVETGDAVYLDRLNHASLIDGARLSGATLRVYPHNDANRLEAILGRDRGRFRRALIATDGVFSMDGDFAPLDRIADLSEHFGAMVVVDEAHGTGVVGPDGRGACARFAVAGRMTARVGTLSKALGSLGGFVAGSGRLIEHLIHRARTMVYSTALPPSCCAAAREALGIVLAEPWRREHLHRMGQHLRTALTASGWRVGPSSGPIVPVLVGDPIMAVTLSESLRARGLLVPAIRPPTVPEGTSRLRISLTARHTDDDVARLVAALGVAGPGTVG